MNKPAQPRHAFLAASCLIATFFLGTGCANRHPPAAADPPPALVAETAYGPVTTRDLEIVTEFGPELPGDMIGTAMVDRRIQRTARYRILHGIGVERGLAGTPQAEEQAWGHARAALARLAEQQLAPPITMPSEDEIDARLAREGIREPLRASWGAMRFLDDESGVPPESRAHQATEALADGEPFGAVARRLATLAPGADPDRLVGPMEYHGRILPAMAAQLDALEPGGISEPFKTAAGWVVIQLAERTGGGTPTDPIVRARAHNEIVKERRREARASLLADLRQDIEFRVPDFDPESASPNDIAFAVGDEAVTAGDFARWAGVSLAERDWRRAVPPREVRLRLAETRLLVEAGLRRALFTRDDLERRVEWFRLSLNSEQLTPRVRADYMERQQARSDFDAGKARAAFWSWFFDEYEYRQVVPGSAIRRGESGKLEVIKE